VLFLSLVKFVVWQSPEGKREGEVGGCLPGALMSVFLVEGKGHL